jgi:hypothetical protein
VRSDVKIKPRLVRRICWAKPSEVDVKVTRDLVLAGQLLKIEVLDHVVIGNPNHCVNPRSCVNVLPSTVNAPPARFDDSTV